MNIKSDIIIAKHDLSKAKHMLNVTYPLTKEPKLLLSILADIFHTLTTLTKIEIDNFEESFEIFKNSYPEINSDLILNMRNIIQKHEECPVEFTRPNKVVMCDNDYKTTNLDPNDIKRYIYKSKEFILSFEALFEYE